MTPDIPGVQYLFDLLTWICWISNVRYWRRILLRSWCIRYVGYTGEGYWVEFEVLVELLPLSSSPCWGHEVFDILNIGHLSQNWILDFGEEYWVKLEVVPLSSSPCQGHEVFDILNIGY